MSDQSERDGAGVSCADPACLLARRLLPALRELTGERLGVRDAHVRESAREHDCDYQCNAALAYAKRLGRAPRELAEALIRSSDLADICEPPLVAGPGFINLRLRSEWVAGELGARLADRRLGVALRQDGGRCVIDYSSPNVAKEMHVGHLRSTVIGDALLRMLRFCGVEVIAQNHIGDWGTPFGMLIEELVEEGAGEDGGAEPQQDGYSIADLDAFYKSAQARFRSDPAFAERARARVVSLQSGEPRTQALWESLVRESERHFREIYDLLSVCLRPEDVAGESAYQPLLEAVAQELSERGLAQISDGALCAFPAGFSGREGGAVPLIIRKQDGGFSYDATDLAALRHRVRELAATEILYVVGAPQRLHFEMVFALAAEAGWLEGASARHVAFGSVLGPDRKMLRTRSGAPVRLLDLLQEAVGRAQAILAERGIGEDRELARTIGIGAVKYADLSTDREHDYIFSFERMLAFEGNTSVYLQYANARAHAVLRRAGIAEQELARSLLGADALCAQPGEDREAATAPPIAAELVLEEPSERALGIALLRFPGALAGALDDYKPHRLCTYLNALAVSFSAFYESCPILEAPAALRESRLALCALVARTLTLGLGLLGIRAPARLSPPPRRSAQ
ncbi:MAG TPA: arginine--tRNA ligase [Solirubrobacteraceae bacterium]|nr:arginine--tRNA ligase [Solirubrobacteraceae bacterium]